MFAIDVQDQILDKLNTLVVVLNNDGSIDYVSKSAQQLLGYNPQDLIGSNWWEITRFTKPEGEQVKNNIVSVLNSGVKSQLFEHELKTASGGKKWIRWNVSYLNAEQLIGVGYDITETKAKEHKLIESNNRLVQQHKDITDSLYYAQRIQQSILQAPKQLNNFFNESFVLYKPKDIVSGDYYWFYEDSKYKFIAAVDCTGHGVPGAMMSMVANSIFKEVFVNQKITNPALILNGIDKELDNSINTNNDATFNDGMDVALVRIDKLTNELVFAGAFRNILIARQTEIVELKGSRYPIGFYSGIEKQFTNTDYKLQQGDTVYLFTDGYIDQFGGERNKKLNKRNFIDLLKTIVDMTLEEQEAFLEYAFSNWKQQNIQTDDVLVIGFKV